MPLMQAVSFDRLQQFIASAFERLGLPADDASTIGALMAEADLQGSDGHGVIRLVPYARRIRAGGVNVKPSITVVQERAGMALLNGDNGMGHLVMKRAAEMAAATTSCRKSSSVRVPSSVENSMSSMNWRA